MRELWEFREDLLALRLHGQLSLSKLPCLDSLSIGVGGMNKMSLAFLKMYLF